MHRFRSWTLDPPEWRTQRNRSLPIEGGDGSTLSLDFTTEVLDPRLTFTRSTTGTLINASGLVESAAINSPRFDYDPTTLTPRGLLIEGQATNLFRYSNPIATTGSYWGLGGYTLGTGATSPDGTPTSSRFTVNSNSGATCSMQQSVTMNATSCTFSIWFKNGTLTGSSSSALTSIAVRNATTATILLRFYFNATNPSSITYVTGSTGASVVAYPNGWYRISATVTSGITSGNLITGYFAGLGGSVNGELNNYADWWGPQMEEGSGASSYIPTGASTVTRNADKMSLLDITPMQWNQTAGTFALSMDVAAETNTTSFLAAWGMYTETPVRVIRNLINNSSGTNPRLFVDTWTSAPTQIISQSISRPASPVLTKFAFALSNSGQAIAMCVNNGAITTGSGTGTMQTPTRLLFHQDPSASDTQYFPIHIRSFKYWPTSLPNAQLQSLTTG
jgi:hypothetical protein